MKTPLFIVAGALLVSPLLQAATELIGGDMHFHGTIVALACSLPPGGDKIEVDFGQIAVKDLYLNGRSQPKAFAINLQNCNPDVFRTLTVTFNGTESKPLPNHLAIDAGGADGASGIAIGMSEADGTPVHLGQGTTPQSIEEGAMSLRFNAWVEGEPDAIKAQAIAFGPFRASGTWTLNYQ